ncbi:YbaB/EbfC family nucleoid-associated protein [Phosphitispora sp. TUW77]|uniref:YbaB/EbfC family nucleoid-associated protein n=1 Tax=Phosphitispora sp. TUW77 TaxID=3152361 RepID=UPI003AB68546
MLDDQMGKLLQQAQKLQSDMAKVQAELKNMRVEAVVDSGSVKVSANGRQEIINIVVDSSIIHPANADVLQELLVNAVNLAMEKSRKLAMQEMNKVTGGMNIPNIPGFF